MVLCDTCKHLGNMASWPCEDCLQGDRYERKPTSNADKIRQMSDEELAFYIFNHPQWVDLDGYLDWLKQEVERDE